MCQASCACPALDHSLGLVCVLAPRDLALLGILVWLELVQGAPAQVLEHSREQARTLEQAHTQVRVRSLAQERTLALERILEPVRIQALELGRTQVLEHSLELEHSLAQVPAHTLALERNLGLAHNLEQARNQVQVHTQARERSLPWAFSPCRRNWPLCRFFQHSCLCSECRPNL